MTLATKKMLRALKGECLSPPPVWLMRQAGRYLPEYRKTRADTGSFLDLCYAPEKAVEVTLQPLRRYNFDAAILFSDILVLPHALGWPVAFREGEGPVLKKMESVAELPKADFARMHAHLAPVYETVKRLSKAIPETTTLIGFSGAPWTIATYMIEGGSSRDFARTKKLAFSRPDDFQKLIDLIVETTGEYLAAQIAAGAECVQIFDSWAGVLPEDAFRRWVIEPARKLRAHLKKAHPNAPVIGFPRGAGPMYVPYVKETNVDAVSLDTTVPLAWAAKHIQPHCTVQGNLDPLMVVAGGAALDQAVDQICAILGDGPFIFNLGHGIVPETPPEHVARLVERVRLAR